MKRFVILLFLLLLCCISIASAEEILILPDDLTSIEDEAFAGDVSLGTVILPNGVTSIGERAFAESSVTSITLPNSLQEIGENAFADCATVTAIVSNGSYAHIYCEEHGIPYVLISEEAIRFQEIRDVVWSDIESIAAAYEDSNGYVTKDEIPSVLAAVGACIEEYYNQGLISEYSIGKTSVYFLPDGCSLECYYVPMVEGYMFGGDDVSLSVLRCIPYNRTSEDGQKPLSGTAINNVADNISSEICIYENAGVYKDKDVDLSPIKEFSTDQVILWCGHGYRKENTGIPYIYLGPQSREFEAALFTAFDRTGLFDNKSVIFLDRFAVTGSFISYYCSDLSGSLVWLGACSSGSTNDLANGFIKCGAKAVVGFSDAVTKLYHDELVTAVFDRMLERNEATSEYYTLTEALAYAQNLCGKSDPYQEEHAVAKIFGNGNYRLIEYTTLSSVVYSKNPYTDETEPLPNATITIVCRDRSETVAEITTDDDGAFSLPIYEGNYKIDIVADDHESFTTSLTIDGPAPVDVQYSLTAKKGSVAGAFTDSFTTDVVEGVALSIANADKEVVWTGSTDADGFYRAYLAPGSYTMSASKEGFESASYSFTIKADTQTTMNKTLKRIVSTVSGTILSSYDEVPLGRLPLAIVDMNDNIIWTGQTSAGTYSQAGKYSAQLPPGEYTLTFTGPCYYDYTLSYVEGEYSFFIIENQSTVLDCTPKCIHRYQTFSGFTSYQEAVTHSESLGAHLATLTTAEENAIIYDKFNSMSYIGLNRDNEDKEWRWVTGEPLEFTSWLFYNGKYQYPLNYEGWDYAQIYTGNKMTPRKWWNQPNSTKTSTTYIFEWDNP